MTSLPLQAVLSAFQSGGRAPLPPSNNKVSAKAHMCMAVVPGVVGMQSAVPAGRQHLAQPSYLCPQACHALTCSCATPCAVACSHSREARGGRPAS